MGPTCARAYRGQSLGTALRSSPIAPLWKPRSPCIGFSMVSDPLGTISGIEGAALAQDVVDERGKRENQQSKRSVGRTGTPPTTPRQLALPSRTPPSSVHE